MSEKADWADRAAKMLFNFAHDLQKREALALIAAHLRLIHNKGFGEGIDAVGATMSATAAAR